jgi:hypothetical protein
MSVILRRKPKSEEAFGKRPKKVSIKTTNSSNFLSDLFRHPAGSKSRWIVTGLLPLFRESPLTHYVRRSFDRL